MLKNISFQETVNGLYKLYVTTQLNEEQLNKLSNKYGEEVVKAALNDKISILSRSFTQNDKISIMFKYEPLELEGKQIKKRIESLQNRFKEKFPNIVISKNIKKQIKRLVSENDGMSIDFEKNESPELNIDDYKLYFQRIKNIAQLSTTEISPDINAYNKALKVAEEWPFLASYVHGNSLIKNLKVLKRQIEFRKEYLNHVSELDRSEKKVIEILIRSFQNRISSHKDLRMCLKQISLKQNHSFTLHRCGILNGEEIQRMQTLFENSRKALDIKFPIFPRSGPCNRNKMYIVISENKTVFKLFKNRKSCQNEIAGFYLSEIGGFSSIVPPIKHTQMIFTTYIKDVIQSPLQIDEESGILKKIELTKKEKKKQLKEKKRKFTKSSISIGKEGIVIEGNKVKAPENYLAVSMPFLPSTSGQEIFEKISCKIQANSPPPPQNISQILLNGLNINKITDNFQNEIKPFLNVDPFYFEMAVLHSLVLGTRDGNLGNYLITEEKIFPIDYEQIMPENNTSDFLLRPLMTKFKVINNKIIPVEMPEYIFNDVCPINCVLLGLPMGNKPFSKRTLEHILENLHVENFIKYHKNRKLFNANQVSAQLERIDIIRSLMKKEIKKEILTLTPRELFLTIVQRHKTYDMLKDKFKLADLFIFMFLGKVPMNVASEEAMQMVDKIKSHSFKQANEIQTAVILGKEVAPFNSEIMESEYFASANSLMELQKAQTDQKIMSEDVGLYYLLTGIKKEIPKSNPQPQIRLMGPRYGGFNRFF